MAILVSNLALQVGLGLDVVSTTASSNQPIPLSDDGQFSAAFGANRGALMKAGAQNISMAAGATGSDVDLTAFVCAETSATLNFSYVVAVILLNSTEDVSALLTLDAGGTNGWTGPGSGWFLKAYGRNTQGGGVPAYLCNPNTTVANRWATSGSLKTVNLVANTPDVATTLTGRLIVIGY